MQMGLQLWVFESVEIATVWSLNSPQHKQPVNTHSTALHTQHSQIDVGFVTQRLLRTEIDVRRGEWCPD